MTGQTIAHYQILEKLGAGGMGEVYKARDTRLKRLVAIKILAPGKVADAARKRRFVQEAQSASALNHPNIVVIHDINTHNGVDFIVMEYIAGKTLDALIPRQGMRLGEVLKTAIPIADGLSAAHAAGIIHRDIKPSNIMVGDDGRVKVLDFGLAKLTWDGPTGEDQATLTERPQTEEGVVVGTIAYMSPEQAEGQKLDGRSDVFSFGALLYEMVTGQRAFRGHSRVSTLSAILRQDPPMPSGIPPELDRILRRALRKDPAKRFQHMDDLRVALDELKEESGSGGPVPTAAAARSRSAVPLLAALGLVCVAGILLFVWNRAAQPPSAQPPQLKLRQLTADSGLTTAPVLSPDGKLVAYTSDRATQSNLDIWVQPLTEGAHAIRLTNNSADDLSPSFSADGGLIAFSSLRDGGGIYIVAALGGEERLLARGGQEPRFSPDGKWVAYSTSGDTMHNSEVYVIPASGGTARRVGSDIGWAGWPVWSPDGKWIAVNGMTGSNRGATSEIWVTPVDGGKSTRTNIRQQLILQKLWNASRYSVEFDWTGNSFLFPSVREAWAIEVVQPGWTAGAARKLASTTGLVRGPRGSPTHAVFSISDVNYHLWALPIDHATGRTKGAARALPSAGGRQNTPSISRDGGRLVYLQASPSGDEIRIREGLEGSDRALVTGLFRARIAPDGSRVAYSSRYNTNAGGMYLLDAGGGQATELISGQETVNLFDWTPTGTEILFWYGTPTRFARIDPKTRERHDVVSHPTLNIHTVELSPDEKWAAFNLPDRGRSIMVAPVRDGKAAGEAEWIEVAGAPARHARPWWSPDGGLLYYISDRDGYGCFWAQRLHPATRRPVGEAFAVHHFHESRRSVVMGATPFGPAVAKDVLVFGLREDSGNVWIAEQ